MVEHYKEIRIPFYENVEDALAVEGLDGAVIETEEANLTKHAIMAAERGLHIHMDKPGGLDAGEFEKLIEIVKSKKLVFSTGYMYRFNPVVRDAIDKIRAGELGEIYSIEAHMNCEHKPQKRQWLERFPGGMMFFLDAEFVETDVFNRYNDIIKNFAEMVCGDKDNPYDYDYERRLHKLILRACGKEV